MKKFKTPKFEIEEFDVEDIITSSSNLDDELPPDRD